MLLIFDHLKSGTDEEVETLRSWSEHDGRHAHTEPGVPQLVSGRPGRHAAPSQCDREAIVLGQLSNPHVAAGAHRSGERREGPLQSWWRTRLADRYEPRHVDRA